MPIKISVTRVREEIYSVAGGTKSESHTLPSTLLLGQMFHEAFARFFGNNEQLQFYSLLANTDLNEQKWKELVQDYVYKNFIGPKLGRNQNQLSDSSEQLVTFWQAVKNMSGWVTGLLWTAGKYAKEKNGFKLLVNPEEPLSLEIQENKWRDSVILTGIADLVLRIPGKPHWCIVELKLGKGCKEADLAQAFLYHQILSEREAKPSGALALVSFRPKIEEYLFKTSEIKEAQKKLKYLIGRLAGVLPQEDLKKEEPAITLVTEENPDKYLEQANHLISIFKEYGKEISLESAPIPGPTFIRYSIKLGKGVKFKTVQNSAQDVQHRLELTEAPHIHLSEGNVIIDIQRPDRRTVLFSHIRDQLPQNDLGIGSSQVPIGVDLNGKLRFADLSEPENVHILVAGTAGSGKSEWLRSALAGLILSNSPDTLRLALIDPKRNAFNEFSNSPFLMNDNALVYPDEQSAKNLLIQLGDEMDRRYRLLQDVQVDTRKQFIMKTGKMMPLIVSVCDEYYDLVNRDRKERDELEEQIFRLGAKARAAGIHLIIATQQPSRQTIKGALDTNIPARIGLKMSKSIESNMLLSQKGAENLLGKGDLLFKNIGDPIRLQSPYLLSEERKIIFEARSAN
ncbi:MAG: DNA translocase FtsK [Desulfobacterales bacterium]|nr:DNA translocase FtsK [Desulfobacterales bacterium]